MNDAMTRWACLPEYSGDDLRGCSVDVGVPGIDEPLSVLVVMAQLVSVLGHSTSGS